MIEIFLYDVSAKKNGTLEVLIRLTRNSVKTQCSYRPQQTTKRRQQMPSPPGPGDRQHDQQSCFSMRQTGTHSERHALRRQLSSRHRGVTQAVISLEH